LGFFFGNSSHGWNTLITTQVWKDQTNPDADPSQGRRYNSTFQFAKNAILNPPSEPSALVLYSLANSLNCNILLSRPSEELAKAYALSLFEYSERTVFITVAEGLPEAHILVINGMYHAGAPLTTV
jgi:hypothetical protein